MNHIFKKIFSKSLGRMIVVSENAKSAGKTDNTTGVVSLNSLSSIQYTNNMATSPKLILQSLVLSIAAISGMNVWAGDVCDGSTMSGEQSLGSSANANGAFVCGSNGFAYSTGATAVSGSPGVDDPDISDIILNVVAGKLVSINDIPVTATGSTTNTITAIDGVNVTAQDVNKFMNSLNNGGSVAFGEISSAFGARNLAIGDFSNALGNNNAALNFVSSAVGSGNTASGEFSSAFGVGNYAEGDNSIAVGSWNTASGIESSAVGSGNTASGADSSAVGYQNTASADNSSVFGSNSTASHIGATALGNNSATDRDNSISVGQAGAEKQITFVKAGTNDTDAVNLKQMTDAIAAGGGGAPVANDNYVQYVKSTALGSASGSAYAVEYDNATNPTKITKVGGVNVTATGKTLDTIITVNGTTLTAEQITKFKNAAEKGGNIALVAQSVAVGTSNMAVGAGAALGLNNLVFGNSGTAIGSGNKVTSNYSSNAIGILNTASGNFSNAVGSSNIASAENSTALGATNIASGIASTALGFSNEASGRFSSAVGVLNTANAENSSAFGSNSTASHLGATALGNNSATDRDNSISVGKAGAEKQITFVKAGTNDTDAVNVAQLKTKMDQTDLSAGLATKADKTTFDVLNSKVSDAAAGLDSKASQVDVTALTGRVIINESGILTLQNGLDVLSANAVVYDSAAKDSITLAGVNNTKLTHLKDAVLNDTSTDAVTGKQLYLTNNSVSVLNTRIDVSNTAFVQGLGGGAAWNNGVFAAPAYIIQGQSKNNVGDALTLVDHQLDSIKTSVSNTVVDAKNYTDQKTVSALSDAKDYADQKAISSLNGAKDYTDQKAAAILSDAKLYGDQKADAALSGAKTYADQKAADGKIYTDQKAVSTLSDAKAYSDQKADAALSNAKTYADQKAADGKIYTDSKIVAVQQKIAENSQFVSINGAGHIASATGTGATAIGVGALASGNQSTAIGAGAQVTGQQSTAVGKGNVVSGNRSGAFGDPNTVTGNESYATGNDNTITSNSSHAVGNNNTINGDKTVVLGNNINTAAKNAVVLGNDSASNRDNTVSVGATGAERQIINVADATQDMDAVNYKQLKASESSSLKSANAYTNERINALNSAFADYQMDTEQRFQKVNERFNRQGAMSAAMMNMSSSAASVKGQNRIGVGAGFQGQEQAVSIGYQRIINENTSLTIGGAFTKDESSGGVGVGFGW